jgi:hypothetical protein
MAGALKIADGGIPFRKVIRDASPCSPGILQQARACQGVSRVALYHQPRCRWHLSAGGEQQHRSA